MPVIKQCSQCGIDYKIPPSEAEKSKYCSRICSNKSQISDLTGQRFDNLIAISRIGGSGSNARWLFRCDCGKTQEIILICIKRGVVYCCERERKTGEKIKENLSQKTKVCSSCKLGKQADEFGIKTPRLCSRQSICKACLAQMRRNWGIANKDRQKEQQRKYFQSEKNKSKRCSWTKQWKERNPLAVRAMRANRRARERQAEGSISRKTINQIYAKQEGKCACCNTSLNGKFHIDHIVPLIKGGSNLPENIQLLTPRCNQLKSTKTMEEYLQKRSIFAEI